MTATAPDPGSDDKRILLQLRGLEDSIRRSGWRYRPLAWEVRWYRRRLRRLMAPR